MATGLDTDSIVKKLMNVEQIPLNQIKQKQQKELWLSDIYRQWNKDLFSFQSNTLFNMKLSSSYNTFDVTSTQSNSVSGTATSIAIPGTYSVAVNQIAESATLVGKVQIDSTKSLGDSSQGSTNQLTSGINIAISVCNDSNNSANVLTVSNFTIQPTDTISTIVSNLNNLKDFSGKSLGLQAIYDSTLKQFIVKTKATGENTNIMFSTDATGQDYLMNKLGFSSLNDNGQNAQITFNGNQVSSSTNNVTVMGVNLSLKSPTALDTNGANTTSSIIVSQNVDPEVKNIKDFVDKYNDLLDRLNQANDEPIYKDYQPLTDDQRSAMSETQINQWEAKAKSGLLHGDPIIKNLVNQMRNTMMSIVGNGSTYNSLSSIGISSKSYQDKGHLYVDETKLRAAIQADPDGVRNLFAQIGDTSKGTNGLMNQLSDSMNQAVKDLTNKAGATGSSQYDQSTIGKLLMSIQKDINTQTDRMSKIEDQYYKQFAAMEAAVNQYNSQSSWLTQQMSSGQ
jgi:flagellar hook-associated protein 2